MRKRVLAMVLAGLMMFETGNVAIASEIKGTVIQQDVIQENSNVAEKKINISEVNWKEEQNPEVSQEEEKKSEINQKKEQTSENIQEKEQEPETSQEEVTQEKTQIPENVQEKEREPEIIQEKEEKPESAEDVQNREIPNISQVKKKEWKPGDIYEGFVYDEYKFDDIEKGTLNNYNDESSEAYILSLDSKKRIKFDFKWIFENIFWEEDEIATTGKAEVGIYKVNEWEGGYFEEYEIIKKVWSEPVTVDLETTSFQKEISLAKGKYLLVFEKKEFSEGCNYIHYQFSAEDLTIYATSISMQKEIHLKKKDETIIQISDVLPFGAELGITWESDNKDIATVSRSGRVTGKRIGKCKVSAILHNGKKYTCNVYVEDPYATSIFIQKKMYLHKKEKATIQVSDIKPLGTQAKITWASDDEDIATVDKNGKVTGKRTGRCKIIATLHNEKEYTCNVYVEDPKFTINSYVLNKGESKNLKVKYIYRSITWKSSDNKIVKVDQKGKITAKKKGKAKIYAKVGDKTINCSIQVDEPKLSSKSVKMLKGTNTTLKVTGTKQKIKWSSSDKKIAVVKAGKITGKKVGKATITAKIGTSNYNCRVTIVGMKLKTTSMKIAVNGKRPILTKKKERNVKWSSDNKKIATVNSNGMVTGKKKGTAVITAKIEGVNYTCKVIVENPKLSEKSMCLENGRVTTLYIQNTTMNAKWSSSDRRIASVDARGTVVGKSRGSAVITAKIGGKSLTCKVRVRGEAPKYSINVGDIVDYNCKFVLFAIKNQGAEAMRVYSKNARLSNKYNAGYNRSLILISFNDILNHSTITPISYVDIQPGQIEYLVYVVNGEPTIYDDSSSIYFDFSYDGENYEAHNYHYSGFNSGLYTRK